jgi:SM-20-related protein
LLNLAALRDAPVAAQPFPFMIVERVVAESDLAKVAVDFPRIKCPGVFPLSELSYGPAVERLVEKVKSRELEALVAEKFEIDLSDKPLMITVRGHCQSRDGRIHADSQDKLITCLLYLNEPRWTQEGGNLRLLRHGASLDQAIAEVPPNGGNFVAFKRTDNSWHGHARYSGRRRVIMFNWVRSNVVLAKNLGRHRLSAVAKRLGWPGLAASHLVRRSQLVGCRHGHLQRFARA